jgi:type VI secretion system protein
MQHALFEVLAGHYSNGRPIDTVAESGEIQLSIMDHLTRLLNARQGSMVHDPDYGLPDIGLIYQSLPYSLEELVEVIRKAVLKYEPRLKRITVNYRPIKTTDCVLQLEVMGQLHNGEQVSYDTYFMSGGYAQIKPGRIRN